MTLKTERGNVYISPEVVTTISGFAATKCFGVKGMAARGVSDGLVQLLRPDSLSKGVKISSAGDGKGIHIELHIVVELGVNIPALSRSITSEVRYIVEKVTSIPVAGVEICVDSVMVENAPEKGKSRV